ncbi:DUF2484 family protein [uncultured Litoreibacter sp.]|uniref:DUF2484 family protein n=1 Tax=uncultured Litoreibacter sp. TaxID=1392394 RepID=UPI002630FF2E|nr:DUF2484 family protein [uncultured Litoreibacter sp.]
MSPSLILAALWAVAATLVALLPMRYQYVPGVTLLIAAPFLIGFIGYEHGIWFAALGLAAFASMFRNPLIYFYRRARGEKPEIPR